MMTTADPDTTGQTAATVVKAVELSRGSAPTWSVLDLLMSIREFIASHITLVALAIFGVIALATWCAVRRYGAAGVAGLLLLTRLALLGHLRSIRRIIRQARRENITLAAAALADD